MREGVARVWRLPAKNSIIMIKKQKPTNKRNARNNVKAGKNAIKVLNNSNPIQIRKKTVKKRFTDGTLSSFTRFVDDVKRGGGGTGKKTQRQLRQKEKESDELKD